jgi:hypothetical protein
VALFSIRTDSLYFVPGHDTVEFRTRAQRVAVRMSAIRQTKFGAGSAWAVHGDSMLAYADGLTGQVTWYRVGRDGATIADTGWLGRRARPVTPDDVLEEQKRLQRLVVAADPARFRHATNLSEPRLIGAPSYWSVASRAMFADDGTLWIGVNRMYTDADEQGEYVVRVGDENTWAVFPPKGGGPAYTVSLRPLFRLTYVANKKLYGFIDNGITAPTIQVYSLRKP